MVANEEHFANVFEPLARFRTPQMEAARLEVHVIGTYTEQAFYQLSHWILACEIGLCSQFPNIIG
jgi:hypothetical protein